jgi:Zn-dependent protease
MGGNESWLLERLLLLIPLLLSLTVHEWAHAYSAYRLGDDTAGRLGRLTLNPIPHIDIIGTILVPMMGVPFGWAKPVPVDPVRFRRDINMSTGVLITAAAGPLSNLLIAVVCVVLLSALLRSNPALVAGDGKSVLFLLYNMISLNVILALFNMLPVYPLDGSRVVDGLISRRLRPAWERFARYSPLLLILIVLFPSLFGFSLLGAPYRLAIDSLFQLSEFIIGL